MRLSRSGRHHGDDQIRQQRRVDRILAELALGFVVMMRWRLAVITAGLNGKLLSASLQLLVLHLN